MVPILVVALILLVGWLLGVFGLYDASTVQHVLLLVGLLLLLIGILQYRDAERRRTPRDESR